MSLNRVTLKDRIWDSVGLITILAVVFSGSLIGALWLGSNPHEKYKTLQVWVLIVVGVGSLIGMCINLRMAEKDLDKLVHEEKT
ncbi:hypothetical protein KAR91_66410 [Candidatus Pacearchaeota archaeon]|nr:hypothetical protein [Candidatus Pacearchaeota archaeon]